jgi:hypothetical protein
VRQDNALDEETILNQQANAQMTYAARFGSNKSLTIKMQQQHNLTTNLLERQIPDVQYQMGGPLFSFLKNNDDDEASEESFLDKLNYSFSNLANLYSKLALDSLAQEDTTAWYSGYNGRLSLDYSGSLFDVINVTPRASFAGMWSGRSWINPEDSIIYRKAENSIDLQDGRFGELAYNHNYSLNTDTKLYGIWVPEIGRFTGIRHVLSPGVSYTYAPEIDSNSYFVPHPLLGQRLIKKNNRRLDFPYLMILISST